MMANGASMFMFCTRWKPIIPMQTRASAKGALRGEARPFRSSWKAAAKTRPTADAL